MGNPLIDGIETNEVDVNIDHKGGYAHGTGTLRPDAHPNGTWQIKFTVNTSTGTSHGIGHGTGDLRGMSLKWETVFSTTPPKPLQHRARPCPCDGDHHDAAWAVTAEPFTSITGIISTPIAP
ncbi:MAG: hypothetical protein V3U63_05665 [Gemmatimonadota bacterium]